jgi:hypothetical protein
LKNGGEAEVAGLREAKLKERKVKGPKKFHRRGEGGEGRARLQDRDQRFCYSSRAGI